MVAAVLRVGSAFPDPPFDVGDGPVPGGFDVDLTRAIAHRLGRTWASVPFRGANFNDIFDLLDAGEVDVIASGTTVTPERAARAEFCAPYLVSGQSLAVDTRRLPGVHGVDDLAGLTIGVQHGNTSELVAERLVADGKAAAVRRYDYRAIEVALDDLSTGGCDAVMKLEPVLRWLVRGRVGVELVATRITREEIALCVRKGDSSLRAQVDAAQAALAADGTLARLVANWLGPTRTPR